MHKIRTLAASVCPHVAICIVLPPCSPSPGAMSGGGDNCNTMCPYVCCVYCPDPVWIPSVHACVDLSFVSSRQYKNVTIKLYDMRLSARTARSRIHTISVDSTATVFTEYSTGTEGFDHFEPPLALAVCRFAFGGFASPFRLPTACDVNRRGACLVLRAVPTAPD